MICTSMDLLLSVIKALEKTVKDQGGIFINRRLSEKVRKLWHLMRRWNEGILEYQAQVIYTSSIAPEK